MGTARICKELNARGIPSPRAKKYWIVSSIYRITCARCGRAMVISHSGCKEHISYYACLSQKSTSYAYSGLEPCTARQVPTKVLDEYVFNYLLEFYHNHDKLAEHIQAVPEGKDMQQHKAALEQMGNAEKELIKQRESVLRWFRQKMLTENDAESQLQDISRQLADIAQMKKAYQAELATIAPARSTAEIAATIKTSFDKGNFTSDEKKPQYGL
nr:recombinase zinc beta ribbon domain-containing protein [Sporomusa sp. KB1]